MGNETRHQVAVQKLFPSPAGLTAVFCYFADEGTQQDLVKKYEANVISFAIVEISEVCWDPWQKKEAIVIRTKKVEPVIVIDDELWSRYVPNPGILSRGPSFGVPSELDLAWDMETEQKNPAAPWFVGLELNGVPYGTKVTTLALPATTVAKRFKRDPLRTK